MDDFAEAGERLTDLVIDAAHIADGMRVIDCGCGIGGTTGVINERFSRVRLTGVNIDESSSPWRARGSWPAPRTRSIFCMPTPAICLSRQSPPMS